MALRAEIITVGDELLTGYVVNTNAAVLGQRLPEAGVEPRWSTVVSDDADEIARAVRRAARRAEIVVVTGGLGPTDDDCTREGVAKSVQRKLVLRKDLVDAMQRRWEQRGLRMAEINVRQAQLPSNAVPITNRMGTAPGFSLRIRGAKVFVIPGVPAEMESMLADVIVPQLKAEYSGQVRKFRTVHTLGWAEARIAETLSRRLGPTRGWTLSYLPRSGGVDLRVGASGPPARVERTLNRATARIRRILGHVAYGTDGDTLENIVGQMLADRGWTVAVAESCTGGMISHLLTNVPGSSTYFERAVVAYSNRAKISLLGVDPKAIRKEGAVSRDVAAQMARGVRRLARSRVGLSATGIAGPGGGSPEKPVGLVYVGLSAGRRASGVRYGFFGDRQAIKLRTARAALNLLRLFLLDGTVEETTP